MEPINKWKYKFLHRYEEDGFNVNWNWLYLRSHLVFAFIVFFGMLVFVWWLTS